MSKFEKKFGKYAIPNLTVVLIACYAAGYILTIFGGGIISYLTLNPYLILKGQIWRIVTWILIPPTDLSIWTLIMLFFYYSIGTTLERTWGTYRYNVYLFQGMLFTIIGSFLCLGYVYLMCATGYYQYTGSIDNMLGTVFGIVSNVGYFSTYYINLSIYLAFAATFPEAQVLLMFVIPVKMKWMGILYGIMIAWWLIGGNVFSRFAIIASLLNFLVFFITSRKSVRLSPKQLKRRTEFQQQVKKGNESKITKHKCAICGRTDESNPDLEFRFCSKCNGNYEYCQDHLFTHEHVK